MAQYKKKEKRKYPRIVANCMILYKSLDFPNGYNLINMRDISCEGALLITHRAFQKGTRLALVMAPASDPCAKLQTNAAVISSKKEPGMVNSVYQTRIKFLEQDIDLYDTVVARIVQEANAV